MSALSKSRYSGGPGTMPATRTNRPGQQSAEHVTEIYGFDSWNSPYHSSLQYMAQILKLSCLDQKKSLARLQQVCSRAFLVRLAFAFWRLGILCSFCSTARSGPCLAGQVLGGILCKGRLFGLLSYFPLSAVILLRPGFKVHARNGPSYWGWPLSWLWLHDNGVTIIHSSS